MTNNQLAQCRKRLEHFLADLVAPLGRSERRHWADVYVRGLLLDGERKSIEPLATRVPDGNVQALQQLVGQSPWDWEPVWERLAQRMTADLSRTPSGSFDDTGFPKQGRALGGRGAAVFGDLGQSTAIAKWRSACTRSESKDTRCWAGGCICRSAGRTIPPGARRPAFPRLSSSRPNGNWGWT